MKCGPIRAQHVDITSDGVSHPPKLCLLRLYLVKRSLKSRSLFVLLGYIHRRTNYFYNVTGSIHCRVSDHMNVLGRAVWQKKPIVGLKLDLLSNCLLDHRSVKTLVLRVQPSDYLHVGWWGRIKIEIEDPVQLF